MMLQKSWKKRLNEQNDKQRLDLNGITSLLSCKVRP
ncbi:hypothetical protein JOE21_000366 [Desmospora profundinema]|uniref:Uncharacterized protein n=1 Tax=Desmospora profundinema TaxID=1571184 RepID=A0ABU1IHY3_9BACL|nr:hypothetical protein [Desmospora profundinema]